MKKHNAMKQKAFLALNLVHEYILSLMTTQYAMTATPIG